MKSVGTSVLHLLDSSENKTFSLIQTGFTGDHSIHSDSHEEIDEEDEFEEEKYSHDFNLDDSYDDGSLTPSLTANYEELLALDETIVKKGLCEAEIKKFPTYTFLSSDQMAKPDSCCVICISTFEVGEIVREIPCGHEFHRDCIDKWLSTSIKCPTCNKYLR